MKNKTQFSAISLVLAVISLVGVPVALAQHRRGHSEDPGWRTGMLRLTSSASAGDVHFQSGMYHVQHVIAGGKHWLVFKQVALGAGYRESNMWEGAEITRLECRVEPVTKSVSNTKIVFTTTSAGERSIQSIQIAGEMVTHILVPKAPAV